MLLFYKIFQKQTAISGNVKNYITYYKNSKNMI